MPPRMYSPQCPATSRSRIAGSRDHVHLERAAKLNGGSKCSKFTGQNEQAACMAPFNVATFSYCSQRNLT